MKSREEKQALEFFSPLHYICKICSKLQYTGSYKSAELLCLKLEFIGKLNE